MKWSIPEKLIELGRKYVEEGRVVLIEQEKEKKIWHAEVLGSKLYHVSLDGTTKENDICECLYWRERKYCKHTVAVELKLRQEGISRIINVETKKKFPVQTVPMAQMFKKGFANLHKPTIEMEKVTPLILEYNVEIIETNNYYPELALLAIALRIGIQGEKPKTYIVKNLGEFFQSFQKQTSYTVSKHYQFDLLQESFTATDQKLLALLLKIYQTTLLAGAHGVQVKGKVDKRYLLVPIDQAKVLLETMSQSYLFSFVGWDNKKYRRIEFSQEKIPINSYLVKEGERYQLTIQNQLTHFLEHYQWGVMDNKIFSFTQEQVEIYLTLKQLVKRLDKPELVYEKEELSELFHSVLPYLETVGSLTISEEIQKEIIQQVGETTFIFKKRNGMIDVRVDFSYGSVRYSTDDKQSIKPVETQYVIRNLSMEHRVIQQLHDLGYEKANRGFEKKIPQKGELYAFFKKEIPLFQRLGEVKLGKKLRELFLDAQTHQPVVSVSDSNSWLSVHFDITGIEEIEIQSILNSLLKEEPFYTLKTGEILSFDSEEYQKTSKLLTKLRETAKLVQGTVQVPKNQGVILGNLLEDQEQAIFTNSFQQLIAHLTHSELFDVTLPKKLHAELRAYQIEGFRWLKMLSHHHLGGILADEMGLGKTVQLITYLLSEKEEKKEMGKVLIVAPASLLYNWSAEMKRFAPDLSVKVVVGQRQVREQIILQTDVEVMITSYASVRRDVATYQALGITYLILDEAQMVKNSVTKTAQALRKLSVLQSFALSGTPIENNLDELWSIFQIILPGLFPTRKLFRDMASDEVAKLVQPFILRREKKNVLADLPEKIESNLYSGLTEEQKKIYLAYLQKMQSDVQKMDQESFRKNRISILAGLTRLRQICCDPALFVEGYTGGSGKLEQLKELLLNAKENNHRVLLFSQFTSMLSIIEKEINQLGIQTFYLRGSTKPKERMEMTEAFNKGEKDVFLISLKAGGTGLNLTGADTVILYDLWWNPAVEEQAAGRAHRIGQKKVVEVWRMIAEGTVEEKMDTLQQEKRELFQKIIRGSDKQVAKLTEEDIRTILSIGEE